LECWGFCHHALTAVVVHTILSGGPAMLDTAKALEAVIEQFPPSVELIVWLNDFFGPIGRTAASALNGHLSTSGTAPRIAGLARLERLNPDAFGRNLRDMFARQMTFGEADQSQEFRIVARQRLRKVWRPVRDQIALMA
jgi:hypothetical protein